MKFGGNNPVFAVTSRVGRPSLQAESDATQRSRKITSQLFFSSFTPSFSPFCASSFRTSWVEQKKKKEKSLKAGSNSFPHTQFYAKLSGAVWPARFATPDSFICVSGERDQSLNAAHFARNSTRTRTDYVRRPAAGIYRRFSRIDWVWKDFQRSPKKAPKFKRFCVFGFFDFQNDLIIQIWPDPPNIIGGCPRFSIFNFFCLSTPWTSNFQFKF